MFKFRPWGWWAVLWQWPLFSKGPRYKLKLLYFKKGGAISMQRHKHRSEDWYMWSGFGRMEKNGQGGYLKASSEYRRAEKITAGDWHQFKAIEATLVLETQRGICQESDIERADI